jgi:hypothetical protein
MYVLATTPEAQKGNLWLCPFIDYDIKFENFCYKRCLNSSPKAAPYLRKWSVVHQWLACIKWPIRPSIDQTIPKLDLVVTDTPVPDSARRREYEEPSANGGRQPRIDPRGDHRDVIGIHFQCRIVYNDRQVEGLDRRCVAIQYRPEAEFCYFCFRAV